MLCDVSILDLNQRNRVDNEGTYWVQKMATFQVFSSGIDGELCGSHGGSQARDNDGFGADASV
jgi:hypothetical protein